LPILNLNGYKIANPTILSRISHEELEALFRGYGYTPYFVEGDDPDTMHQTMAATLNTAIGEIRAIQKSARSSGKAERPRWPMIVLAFAQGLDRPEGDQPATRPRAPGVHIRCRFRMCVKIQAFELLQDWMKSYKPEELFDANGVLVPELQELAPRVVGA